MIPVEKSRKVIYLERRGKERKRMPVLTILADTIGILCLLYCLGIGLFMGYGTRFFLVWGALGAGLIFLGWAVGNQGLMERLPFGVKLTAGIVLGAGMLLFVAVEGLIISKFHAAAPPGADYLIVLGAQWKEKGPSDVLKRRLDQALTYLRENPGTLVIVSGGQGKNEPVPEARGMAEYLIAAGVGPERILVEDASENTYGNLKNSGALLDKEKNTVVVVTNNFHMYRALGIAGKNGYAKVYGLAADSYPGMLPNNLLREFFGVVKDIAVGNM